jgi:hypothetical protein
MAPQQHIHAWFASWWAGCAEGAVNGPLSCAQGSSLAWHNLQRWNAGMLECWNAPRTPPHRQRQSIRRQAAQAAPSCSACIRAELAILRCMVLSITMPANRKLPSARRAYAGLQPDEPDGLNKRRLVLNVLGCERCDSHRRGSFVPQHSALYHHTISPLSSSLTPSPVLTISFLINHILHHLSQ